MGGVISKEKSIGYWCDTNKDVGKKIINSYIGDRSLYTIGRTSKIKLEFKCSECNNEFEKTAGHISRGQWCPYCNNKNNNLATIDINSKRRLINSEYSNLINEWSFELNLEDINDVLVTSNKKCWWECSCCGNIWEAIVANRTKNKRGCPKCALGNQGSFLEYALYLVIQEHYKNAEYQFKVNNMSFDIGVPELKLVIEYQGRYTHSNKYVKNYDVEKRDMEKRRFLESYKDITFITINETYGGSKIKSEGFDIYFNADNKNNTEVIKYIVDEINSILNIKLNVRDDIETYTLTRLQIKNIDDSLGKLYPKLSEEWDYTKNGILTPFKLKPKSNKRVWWLCSKCGYSWNTSPCHRVLDNTGCPKCVVLKGSGAGSHLVIKGINDLASLRPDIASEWCYELNNNMGLSLENISIKSNKSVWWKCSECGKVYEDKVIYRTTRNHNCPLCNNEGIADFNF